MEEETQYRANIDERLMTLERRIWNLENRISDLWEVGSVKLPWPIEVESDWWAWLFGKLYREPRVRAVVPGVVVECIPLWDGAGNREYLWKVWVQRWGTEWIEEVRWTKEIAEHFTEDDIYNQLNTAYLKCLHGLRQKREERQGNG